MSIIKRIIGALVVLAVVCGVVWFIVMPTMHKQPAPVATESKEQAVFKSNMESLNQKNLAKAARIALADDSEKSIRVWVEEGFTSYDHVKVTIAGDKIDNITEINPYPIVRSYTKDPRVVVAENARWWCGQYDSKAKSDRISRLEKMHHVNAIEAPPTAPKVEVGSCNPFAPGKVFRNKHSATSQDEEEKNQQVKDNAEFIRYRIQDRERMLRNVQQDIMTSSCKDPEVKADRRAQVCNLQEQIKEERAKLGKLGAGLR